MREQRIYCRGCKHRNTCPILLCIVKVSLRIADEEAHRSSSSCGSCTWLRFSSPTRSLTQHSALTCSLFPFRLLPLANTLLMNARHGRLGGWWKNQLMSGEWWSTTEAQAHVLRGSILAPFSVAPSSVSDTVTY